MNREGIRRLAAEEIGVKTSPYAFVDSLEELTEAADQLGWPVVIKPVMSSRGHGQSLVRTPEGLAAAWEHARSSGRGTQATRCIVEGFVDFDTDITLLTVRHAEDTTRFDPIFHLQIDGDYAESWQEPSGSSWPWLTAARDTAGRVTDALGGWGIFGVELFIRGENVIFSEVSPRPHDTGLVTLVGQDMSEFDGLEAAYAVDPPSNCGSSGSRASTGSAGSQSPSDAAKVPTTPGLLHGLPPTLSPSD